MFLVCPRQYANSCLSKADGDVKAAAIASIAALVCADGGWHARCFNEKRARNRRARGTVSVVSAFRSASTVLLVAGGSVSGIISIGEGSGFYRRISSSTQRLGIRAQIQNLGL